MAIILDFTVRRRRPGALVIGAINLEPACAPVPGDAESGRRKSVQHTKAAKLYRKQLKSIY